jgi:osmoprotectant transport system permease protein
MKPAFKTLLWPSIALALLTTQMTQLAPLFAALFPQLDRPLYVQQSFASLLLAHVLLVAAASSCAAALGIAIGVFVTRRTGRQFRPLFDSLLTAAQTVPPVAVLALCVPLIGFGFWPAFVALVLYAVLPIAQATAAGLAAVPRGLSEAAMAFGMPDFQRLTWVELPIAAPHIWAGLRSATLINIGTAAIASTVGANTLGTPIIVGLSGFNTAYVLQGAILVALLAWWVDAAFDAGFDAQSGSPPPG